MKRLLLVDDDAALRRLMRLELRDTFEIIDSGESEQGLALALEYKPDAILLDLRMPKYSGYELLHRFMSFSRTQAIPVIIVSGEAGGDTKQHCRDLGATAYFEKPIDFETLRACLRDIAERRQDIVCSQVRVPLRVSLKLKIGDGDTQIREVDVTTQEVSLDSFLCDCSAEMLLGSIVDVYLGRDGENYSGKARIIHSQSKSRAVRSYECQFIDKTGIWLLQ